jgi:hypothetical protein
VAGDDEKKATIKIEIGPMWDIVNVRNVKPAPRLIRDPPDARAFDRSTNGIGTPAPGWEAARSQKYPT